MKPQKKKLFIYQEKIKKIFNNQGIVSLFLCLMLIVLIPIVLLIIEQARFSSMKVVVECATDISTDSILAEYNRELLNQYDLLFVDTAYSDTTGSTDNTALHLENYMKYNLSPDQDLLLSSRDLFGLSINSAEITRVSRATDNGGAVFRHMAVSYMLDYFGYSYASSAKDFISEVNTGNLLDIDISDTITDSIDAFENYDFEANSDSDEDFEEVEITNPSSDLSDSIDKGILSLTVTDTISATSTNLNLYSSHRDLVAGDGLYSDWPDYNDILDELLFDEYISQKCGSFKTPKENSLLSYEIEYIICGKNSDKNNLKDIATKLLILRGGANTITYYQSPILLSESNTLAASLSAIFPPIQPIVKALIDACWIYAESMYDVRVVMNGGRIPILKQSTEWNLTLENALFNFSSLTTVSDNYESYNKGLNYDEYLKIFLYLTDTTAKTKRCMDIVEMDIRKALNNDYFKLDNCVAAFEVQMIVESSLGYSFLITKDFSYW